MKTEFIIGNNDVKEYGVHLKASSLPEEHYDASAFMPKSLPVVDELLKDQELTTEEKANAILKLSITALRP